MTLLLLFAVGLLACSNGANDNFKGVASLFGSRTASYQSALAWATATTLAGSVAAGFLAASLLQRFSGKGLVPDSLVGSEHFLLAVAVGAGLTVLLATFLGFPVSTTHALTGALVGGGGMAAGSQVQLAVLGKAFLLPLLLSPVLAILLSALMYRLLHTVRIRMGVTREWCMCVGQEEAVCAAAQPAHALVLDAGTRRVTARVDQLCNCERRYAGQLLGLSAQQVMDSAHFLSAGVVSFARGLNDTPKIAALLLLVPALAGRNAMLATAVAIALGGVLGARRVAETMSRRLTRMNDGQGCSANLATGALVIAASLGGLPVSTTHVSVGSLFGIGATTGQADARVMRSIVLSWLVTLPLAALLSAGVYLLVRGS